jgi:hypothetical protein
VLDLAAIHHVQNGIAGIIIGAFVILVVRALRWNNDLLYRAWKAPLGERIGGFAGDVNRIAVVLLGAAMIVLGILSIIGYV